jgi:hypothetical protein
MIMIIVIILLGMWVTLGGWKFYTIKGNNLY